MRAELRTAARAFAHAQRSQIRAEHRAAPACAAAARDLVNAGTGKDGSALAVLLSALVWSAHPRRTLARRPKPRPAGRRRPPDRPAPPSRLRPDSRTPARRPRPAPAQPGHPRHPRQRRTHRHPRPRRPHPRRPRLARPRHRPRRRRSRRPQTRPTPQGSRRATRTPHRPQARPRPARPHPTHGPQPRPQPPSRSSFPAIHPSLDHSPAHQRTDAAAPHAPERSPASPPVGSEWRIDAGGSGIPGCLQRARMLFIDSVTSPNARVDHVAPSVDSPWAP